MPITRKPPLTKSPPPRVSLSLPVQEGPPDILMVEDSATDAELALRAFRRAKIANPLTIVSSSEQALAYLFGTDAYAQRGPTRPLLILLDLQLPEMSGLDFLRQIKIDERTMDIAVVSISMTKSAPAVVLCLQRGVVAHIIKPVDCAELVRVTKRLQLDLTLVPRGPAPATT